MDNARSCEVSGKPAYCHGFYERAYTHGPGIGSGSYPAGAEAYPVAVVEYMDGEVAVVRAETVRFCDGAHADARP